MITLTEEQAQQIEESLGDFSMYVQTNNEVFWDDAISKLQKVASTIRAARAQEQAEQEPVAWRWKNGNDWLNQYTYLDNGAPDYPELCEPLYAAPVRTKDLTDEELWEAAKTAKSNDLIDAFRAVIAADREKNK